MKTWNFTINNTVVATINQSQGQNKGSFYWVVVDKVYELTQRYGGTVGVYSRVGNQEYSYV